MGKPTGFLEIERQVSTEVEPLKRIKNFNEWIVEFLSVKMEK